MGQYNPAMKQKKWGGIRQIPIAVTVLILLASVQAQQNEDKFPSEQQIKLLLTQAERALDSYADAVQLEQQLVGGIESAEKERNSLKITRETLTTLKKAPVKGFASPMGFLLVTNLEDASRNMAL